VGRLIELGLGRERKKKKQQVKKVWLFHGGLLGRLQIRLPQSAQIKIVFLKGQNFKEGNLF
jgi:hypothetical protein